MYYKRNLTVFPNVIIHVCIVAKPLVVDGTTKFHELSLAYVDTSLPLLDPPLVLQEFVNHGIYTFSVVYIFAIVSIYTNSDFVFFFFEGGILFKVYIVGETIRVVRRFSLPDVNTYDLGNNDGIFRFPRVSCATNNAENADVDPCIAGKGLLHKNMTFCIISKKEHDIFLVHQCPILAVVSYVIFKYMSY